VGRLVATLLLASAAGAAGALEKAPALRDAAQGAFRIGAALNRSQIEGRDVRALEIVTRQFATITPENVLKWEVVHPEPERYDFAPVDRFVELGERHGMFIVGHVLLWHQQTPAWVFGGKDGAPLDRETLLARLRDHIQTVVGRYRGRIHGWDVVNEAFEDDGSWRKTPWLETLGPEYVETAFRLAHEADPEAELYYNDYNLWKPAKRAAAIRLVKDLQARGVRVDGLGEQGHWGIGDPSLAEVEAMLADVRSAGLRILITELDVDVLPRDPDMWGADLSKRVKIRAKTNVYPDGLPDEVQRRLAQSYGGLFALFVKYRDVVTRVTFWGVTDADTWLDDFPIPGRVNYPLLWDRNGRPKPAFEAVLEALEKR